MLPKITPFIIILLFHSTTVVYVYVWRGGEGREGGGEGESSDPMWRLGKAPPVSGCSPHTRRRVQEDS